MDGIVTRIRDNGYGFIKTADRAKDVFFHAQSLVDLAFDDLKEGDVVGFEIVEGPKGPAAAHVRRNGEFDSWESWTAPSYTEETPTTQIVISDVLESFKELTPQLLSHLRQHNDDVERVSPAVFEHLIAELLAGAGWSDVRLVGRNSKTQADVFAMHFLPPAGKVPFRLFVEAKRWRNRIGVEVINQVLGAMVSEKDRFGWHAAMIVCLTGVKNLKRYSLDEYQRKGLEVRDKDDILQWLREYRCNPDGLWVQANFSQTIP